MKTNCHFRSAAALLLLAVIGAGLGNAQSVPSGSIEGVVINQTNGKRLERARIRVLETGRETFSDADGLYRLTAVPAGTVTVQAFFTGLDAQSSRVTVAPGALVQHEIRLSAVGRVPAPGEPAVQLDEVVVSASREMDGAAIAINEQRFAPNVVNVIAAGEFGSVADGDIGELLKYVPGITMEYAAGDARRVGLDGVAADYVPVTIGGFNLAHTVQGTTDRGVELNQVSLNNISRVEVIQSPTPESQGAALAGSVNFVPRSAFELTKPVFKVSGYLTMSDEAKKLGKSVGQRHGRAHTVYPGFELSYVVPVNARFGFSLSASGSTIYSPRNSMSNIWRGANGATNGGTFPDTTPDQPYLTDYSRVDGPFMRYRSSVALTVDYKLSRSDRFSFSIDRTHFGSASNNHTLGFSVGRVAPGDFSLTRVRGAAGAGSFRITQANAARDALTLMPTLIYRHDGPVWKAEGGAGYSRASDLLRNADQNYFQSAQAQRTGVTVTFDEITDLRPGVIAVTDAAGAPVDPYDIRSYAMNTASSSETYTTDTQRSVYGNLRRDFDWRGVPFTLKGGLDLRNSIRDSRRKPDSATSLTYVGADRRASSTPIGSDDTAAPFFDEKMVGRDVGFGFPPAPALSNEILWDFYEKNPGHFTGNPSTEYVGTINASKRAEEIVSAAFLRADVGLLERRLKLVGGLRAEQTNVKAEGPLNDPTRNFQRDASGRILRAPNGTPLPLTTDALESSRLTRIDRGQRVDKEYLRWFPSLNASYSLRENMVARAAYYHSIGRPNFNQYAGGLTLPNTDAAPSTGNRITVNNAGIKAWSARTVKLSLEYYFERVGLFSVGAFRREFENFFGTTVFMPTAEFLGLYGLEPDLYGDYEVSTQRNLPGKVRMEGYNFNYKQALTFLPSWARGVQVFANASVQRALGDESANFSGYIPRTANWGVSLTRPSFEMRVNWNYRARSRANQVTGRSIGDGTFNWNSERLYTDISGEYRFLKRFAAFAKLRNFTDQPEDGETAGPLTPYPASFRSRVKFGALWTFGVRATF